MLLLGVCNPRGENESYNGLYLKESEIAGIARKGLYGVPVKQEHTGNNVGKVVSCYVNNGGQMCCVLEINEHNFEGMIASGFVRDGVASELSLGYTVDVSHSEGSNLRAGDKIVREISIVRKGARKGCYILAHDSIPVFEKNDVWSEFFDMS